MICFKVFSFFTVASSTENVPNIVPVSAECNYLTKCKVDYERPLLLQYQTVESSIKLNN